MRARYLKKSIKVQLEQGMSLSFDDKLLPIRLRLLKGEKKGKFSGTCPERFLPGKREKSFPCIFSPTSIFCWNFSWQILLPVRPIAYPGQLVISFCPRWRLWLVFPRSFLILFLLHLIRVPCEVPSPWSHNRPRTLPTPTQLHPPTFFGNRQLRDDPIPPISRTREFPLDPSNWRSIATHMLQYLRTWSFDLE
jgi:hypothetical protein